MNAISLQTEREIARSYALIEHPEQRRLIDEDRRFKVVPAGRRSGKTERAKRFVASMAIENADEMYFIAAPTRDQVKKIYWQDMKKLVVPSLNCRGKSPSETELTIFMDNGSQIQLIGLDKPERMEGVFWSGGVIDEIADVKEDAWAVNISPALDTFNPSRPDYRAWCWLIGVPDGLNHFYEMAEYAKSSGDPDWGIYHWKSAEILPASTIDAARRRMSLKQFKQEYEASFETASGRIYEDYSSANYTEAAIEPHEQLCWYHDFNYTPLSSGIGVRRGEGGKQVYCLEEIVLTSAVARQSALEFVDRYKNHKNRHVLIYGDPSGRAGEKHGHASDYTEIEQVLRSNNWTLTRRVKPSTMSIKDGQNAVRAKILNAAGEVSLFVNPQTAPYTHKSLATGQLKKGSTFLEEDSEYQHIGTAVRYFIDFEFPIAGRLGRIQIAGN
jgi:hypothetical protein